MSISQLSPSEFSQRAHMLLAAACPTKDDTAAFNRHMTAAKAQGMSWVEGLQYVIDQRHGNSTVN